MDIRVVNNNAYSDVDIHLSSGENNVLIYDLCFHTEKPCTPQQIPVELHMR